jgi:hypothetical protein
MSYQMRNFSSWAAAAALLLAIGPFSAHAFPVGPAPSGLAAPDLIPVAEGCGEGFHRDRAGVCVRNGGPAVVVTPGAVVVAPVVPVPGVVVEERKCPAGMHWGAERRRCVVN